MTQTLEENIQKQIENLSNISNKHIELINEIDKKYERLECTLEAISKKIDVIEETSNKDRQIRHDRFYENIKSIMMIVISAIVGYLFSKI
jgi:archaellum component FlaC